MLLVYCWKRSGKPWKNADFAILESSAFSIWVKPWLLSNFSIIGPITPQNSGFLAVQRVDDNSVCFYLFSSLSCFCYHARILRQVFHFFLSLQISKASFRIAATGTIIDLDKSTEIVKKLKLTGTPFKIFKKTCFIKVHRNFSFN